MRACPVVAMLACAARDTIGLTVSNILNSSGSNVDGAGSRCVEATPGTSGLNVTTGRRAAGNGSARSASSRASTVILRPLPALGTGRTPAAWGKDAGSCAVDGCALNTLDTDVKIFCTADGAGAGVTAGREGAKLDGFGVGAGAGAGASITASISAGARSKKLLPGCSSYLMSLRWKSSSQMPCFESPELGERGAHAHPRLPTETS